MRIASRIVWSCAALAAIAGILCFYVVSVPAGGADRGAEVGRYLSQRTSPPLSAALGALAVVGAIAAVTTGRRVRAQQPPPASFSPMLSTADNAAAARELIAELSAALRPLAAAKEPDVVRLLDELIGGAVRVGASDIHLHPVEAGTDVAFRIHGLMETVMRLTPETHPRLVMRLKVISNLVTFQSDRPQDGRFTANTSSGPSDVRVAILPTSHGEKAVLRILRTGVELPSLASLGFPPELLTRFEELARLPQGMIFVNGPTGNGKTTTLYATLGHIKASRPGGVQIATIEDPVEYDVPFLTQTAASPKHGLSFAQGLRSILRQDPNVIMVGEIRDAETAHIAVQAGQTGHLILTSVHADSSAGVFNRLIEMGIEPFLLASASAASLSQRLLRALCPHCRLQVPISPEEAALVQLAKRPGGMFWDAPGCERCGGTGFLGRTAIFELLPVTPAIREVVTARVTTGEIFAAAVREGMRPLLAAGIEHARTGATTLREVMRMAG